MSNDRSGHDPAPEPIAETRLRNESRRLWRIIWPAPEKQSSGAGLSSQLPKMELTWIVLHSRWSRLHKNI